MSSASDRSRPSPGPPSSTAPPTSRPGFDRLLVASDGSAPAERAFAIAARLAGALAVPLEVVTVVPTHPEYAVGTIAGAPMPLPDEEERRYYREIGERLRQRAARAGVPATGELREGHPGAVVLEEARFGAPALVVVGARGLSATHRILLGSVSTAVASRATRSVLVVRGSSPDEGAPGFDRIVVALDGSRPATVALDVGVGLARAFGAPLGIVTAVPEPAALFRSDRQRRREEEELRAAEAMVAGARARAEAAGVADVTTEVLRGDAAIAVLGYLDDGSGHLVVVGSRGLSPTRRLFLGSVSTAILHHAPCSVLIARDRPRGEATRRSR